MMAICPVLLKACKKKKIGSSTKLTRLLSEPLVMEL
jgi:hypothetical protein